MSWDQYRKSQVIRVTLEDIGFPEFWIDVRKPGSYNLDEMEIIGRLDNPGASIKEIKAAIPIVISDWNITSPKDGKLLQTPDKNAKSLDVLPMDVFRIIGEKMKKLIEEMPDETVPEKIGT